MADKKYDHVIKMTYDKASYDKAEREMKGSINKTIAEIDKMFDKLKDGENIDFQNLTEMMKELSLHTANSKDNYTLLQGQIDALKKKMSGLETILSSTNSSLDTMDGNIQKVITDMRALITPLEKNVTSILTRLDVGEVNIAIRPSANAQQWSTAINNFIQKDVKKNIKPLEIDITPKQSEKLDEKIKEIKGVKLGGAEDDTTESDINQIKNRFKSIRQAITDERKGLNDEVKKWRQSINKNLDLEFKFTGLGDRAVKNISADLVEAIDEVNKELVNHPLVLHTNVDDLAKTIEERLNKIKIDNITVGDIKANGSLSIDGPATLTGSTVVRGGSTPVAPAVMSKASVDKLADAIANSINGTKKGTGSTVPKEAPAQKSRKKKEKQEETKIFAGHVADMYKKLSGDLNNPNGRGQKNAIQKNFPEMHKALQALVANPNDETLMKVLESSDFAAFAKDWGNPKSLIPIIAQAISRSRSDTDVFGNEVQDKADIANINQAYANAVKKDNFNITPETSPNLHNAITLLHRFASVDNSFSHKMSALTEFALGLDDTQIATEGSRSAQAFENIRGIFTDIAAFVNNDTVLRQPVKDKEGNIVKDENGKDVFEDIKMVDMLKKSDSFREIMSTISSIDVNNITKDTMQSLMKLKNIGDFFDNYGSYITRTAKDSNGNVNTFSPIDAVFDDPRLAQTVYNVLFREADLSGEIAPLLTGASKNKFDFTQMMLGLEKEFAKELGKDYSVEGVVSARAAGAQAKEIMKWMYEYAKVLQHISKLHNTRRNPEQLSFESIEEQSEWISQQKVTKNDLNEMINYMTSDEAFKIQDMQAELAKKQEKIDAYNASITTGENGLKRFKVNEQNSDAYRRQAEILAKDIRARDALTKEYQVLEAKIEEAREPERNAILKLLGMTEANVVDVGDENAKMSQALAPIFGAIADFKRQTPDVNALKDKLSPTMKKALEEEGSYNTNLADLLVKELIKATKESTTQGKQVRSIFKENGVNVAMIKRLQDENLETEEQWKILENGIFNNPNVDFNKLISDLNAGSAALKKGYPRFISLLQYAERYADVVWKTDSSHLSALGKIDNAVKTVRFGEVETKDKAVVRKMEMKPSQIIEGRLKHAQEIADIKTPAYELMLQQEELMAERTKAQIDYMERNKVSMVDTKDQRSIFEGMAETQKLGEDYRARIKEAIQLFDSGKTIDQQVIDAKEKHLRASNALAQAEASLLNAISDEEDKAIAKSYIDGEMLNKKQQQRFDNLILPEKEQYKAALAASNDTKTQLDVVQKMKDAVSIDSIKDLYAQQKHAVEVLRQGIQSFTTDVDRLKRELEAALADEAANPDRKYTYLYEEDFTRKRRQGGFDKVAAGYQFVVVDEKGRSLKVGDWAGAEGVDDTVNDGGFQYNKVVKEFPKWTDKNKVLTAGFSRTTAKELGMPTYVNTAVKPPARYKKSYITNAVSAIDGRIRKAEQDLNNLAANVDMVVDDLVNQIVNKIHTIDTEVAKNSKKVEGSWSVLKQTDAKSELQSELALARIKADRAEAETAVQAQLLADRKKFAEINPKMQLPDYETFIQQDEQTIHAILRSILEDAKEQSKAVWLKYDDQIASLNIELDDVKAQKLEVINDRNLQQNRVDAAADRYGIGSDEHTEETAKLSKIFAHITEIASEENRIKHEIAAVTHERDNRNLDDLRYDDKVIANAIDAFTTNYDRRAYDFLKEVQQEVTLDPQDDVLVAQKAYDAAVSKEQAAKEHVKDVTDRLAVAEQNLVTARQEAHERIKSAQTSTSNQITDDERKVVNVAAQLADAKKAHDDALSVVAKSEEEIALKDKNVAAAKAKIEALQKDLRELVKATTGLTDEQMLAQAEDALKNQRAHLNEIITASREEKEKLLSGNIEDSNLVKDMGSLKSTQQLIARYVDYYNQQDNILSETLDKQRVEYEDAKDDENVTQAYKEKLRAEIKATEERRRIIREEKAWMKDQQRAINELYDTRLNALRDKYNASMPGQKPAEDSAAKESVSDSSSPVNDTVASEVSGNVKDLLAQALAGVGISDGTLMLAGLPEDIATETTLKQVLRALTGPYNQEIMDIEEQLKTEYAKLAALDNKGNTPPTPPTTPPSGGSTPPAAVSKKTSGKTKSDIVEDELTAVKKRTVRELQNRLHKDKSLTEQQKTAITNAIKLINEENVLSDKIISAEKARLEADKTLMSIGKKTKGLANTTKNAYVKQALGETLTADEQKRINGVASADKKKAVEAYGLAGANLTRAITEYVDSVVGKVAENVKKTEPKKPTKEKVDTSKDVKSTKEATTKVEEKAKTLKDEYSKASKENLAMIEKLVAAKEKDDSLQEHERQKIATVIKYLDSRSKLSTKLKALQEVEAAEKQLDEAFKNSKDNKMAKDVAKVLAKKGELSAEQQKWYDKYPTKGPKSKAITAYKGAIGKLGGDPNWQKNAFDLAQKILGMSDTSEDDAKAEAAVAKIEAKMGAIEQRVAIIANKMSDPNISDGEKRNLLAEAKRLKDGMVAVKSAQPSQQHSTSNDFAKSAIDKSVGQSQKDFLANVKKTYDEINTGLELFRERSFAFNKKGVSQVLMGVNTATRSYVNTNRNAVIGGHMHPENSLFSAVDIFNREQQTKNGWTPYLQKELLLTPDFMFEINDIQKIAQESWQNIYQAFEAIESAGRVGLQMGAKTELKASVLKSYLGDKFQAYMYDEKGETVKYTDDIGTTSTSLLKDILSVLSKKFIDGTDIDTLHNHKDFASLKRFDTNYNKPRLNSKLLTVMQQALDHNKDLDVMGTVIGKNGKVFFQTLMDGLARNSKNYGEDSPYWEIEKKYKENPNDINALRPLLEQFLKKSSTPVIDDRIDDIWNKLYPSDSVVKGAKLQIDTDSEKAVVNALTGGDGKVEVKVEPIVEKDDYQFAKVKNENGFETLLNSDDPRAVAEFMNRQFNGANPTVVVNPEVKPEELANAVDIANTRADTTIETPVEIPAGEVAQEITEAEQRGETIADLVPEVPTTPINTPTADAPEAVDERTQILNTIAQLEQKLADAKSQGGYLATEAKQDAIIEILKGGLKVDGTTAKGEGSGNKKQKDDDGDKVKYTLQADNVTKRKATIDARMKNLYGDNIIQQKTDSMSEAWDEYNKRYDAFLENERKAFANGKKITEQEKQNLINEQAELTVVENQLKKQISRAEKLKVTEIDRIDYNKNDNIDMQTQMKWFAGIDDSAEYQWKFNKETQTATYVIEGANNSIREMTISYDALSQSLVKGEKKQIASFSNMEKFIQGIKSKWVEVARYMASFASLYRVFGEIRKGVQYVRDIDKALTELKKVTDATDATYDKFLKNMSKTAGVIGSTTSQLTTMASEWARLGYSIEEAGELAESTAILLNVSEFSDATQASEALISTMQAFQYTADESQHVVDVLNEVGNNYAVSSDGIATALQDSASALMAAGNNLEQSVALVAAANKVVQDPNSVGSALRTISLRLRGTSVEVLEEMGEETDGVVTSLSKMQSKIKALTGVDILTDTGAYKDTYTILAEIGKVWEGMADMDQAAVLELMAGKNRANTLSAILSNMKDLKGAYEDALQAEGSALRENEAYLDSIQGRIDLFTNAVQTMWMNLISSDLIKGIVDLGTVLIKTIDQIGVVGTSTFALMSSFILKNKINLGQLVTEFKNWGRLFATGLGAQNFTNGGMFAYMRQMFDGENLSKQASTIWQDITASEGFDIKDKDFIKERLDEAFASGTITKATYAEVVAKKGLAATNTEVAATNVGLSATLKTLTGSMKTFLTTTAAGQAILAGGIALALVALYKLYDKFGPTHNHFLEQLEEETQEYQEAKTALDDLNAELNTTNDRIDELKTKGTLSFVEQEELERLEQISEELERQEKIYEARAKRERQDQLEVAKKAIETDPNFNNNTTEYYVAQGIPYGAALQTREQLNADGKNTVERNLDLLTNAITNEDKALTEMQSALEQYNKTDEELKNFNPALNADGRYEALKARHDADRKAYEQAVKAYEDAQTSTQRINKNLQASFDDFDKKYGTIGYIENATTEDEKWWNKKYNEEQDYRDQQRLLDPNSGFLKSDVMARYFGRTGIESAQNFKKQFDEEVKSGRSPEVVIAELLNGGDFTDVTSTLFNKFGITTDEITGYFTKVGEAIQTELNSVDAYSVVAESVTKYKEVLQQTADMIVDNTKVTQEYKDSLIALGISESDLNECFDENNKLIVKDADGLNRLVKTTKNNVSQNVKLAKAQAQLQYQSLSKKMRVNVAWMAAQAGAYSIVSQAVEENVSMLEEQLESLDQLIQKYALLELSMSNAGQAYADYESAKERDAELTYDESFLEMLKTIDEGLLKNETGTEAFEYAVKAVVPEEFWKDIDDVEKKIQSIHDYIDGDSIFSRFFYVDEESGELDITADNVRAFVEEGLKQRDGRSIFTGVSTDFDLSDDITGIKDVADMLGVTEAAVLAMFTALEKVDAKWGDILTEVSMTPFERSIHSATQDIVELNKQFAEGKISAEEYAKRVAAPEQELDGYAQQVKDKLLGSDQGTEDTSDDTLGFIELDKQATEAKKELDKSIQELTDAQKKYNEAKDNEETNPEELQQYADAVDEATRKVGDHTTAWQELIAKRGEYPSEYEIQFVIGEIDQEIQKIESGNAKIKKAFEDNFELTSNGRYELKVDAKVNIDELEATYPGIKEYVDLMNTQTTIQAFADTTSAENDANELQQTVDNIIAAIEQNLITLDLDEAAVNNIVTQANNILSGIISSLGVTISASMPSWMQTVLGWMGFDTSNEQQAPVTSGAGMALGNAYASGTPGLSAPEHGAVVGEIGPEMVVDPIKGEYYTVGNRGTEMVDLPKGAIIYNHKQTEELLKNGHTSRGRYIGGLAFARGNAYANHGIPSYHPNLDDKTSFANGTAINTKWDDSIRDLSNAADNLSDSADKFEEVFDWIEVRLEEIEEQLSLLNAQLENAVGYQAQNQIIDAELNVNDIKLKNLEAGMEEYEKYGSALLSKVPAAYREAAQNGAIAIEEFAGEADEATLEAIKNYREWIQKSADLKQQIEETKAEISALAKQKFDNLTAQFENEIGLIEAANDKLDAQISLMEDRGYVAAKEYYEMMAENTAARQEALRKERDAAQAVLDAEVLAGRIKVGSDDWYDAINVLYDIDASIVECTSDLEGFQNAINDIYWDNFDELLRRYDYISEEAQNIVDLLSRDDMVVKMDNENGWSADEVEWTKEGIASLGLYAQQMEVARRKAKEYNKAIADLTKDYEDGKYSESEYLEKLNELKNDQYDAIKSYHDAEDAIKDLNSEMVDMVKEGLEKQIEAYEKLADKRKEALDAEKDAYDWEKSVSKQTKSIADIDRQIAALAGNNSITATAKRKQLEAERAELQAELDDMFYERSVEKQKEAIDAEVETFKESKEEEIKKWEEYLDNVEVVVADSLGVVQANASGVYDTLTGKAKDYGVSISTAITTPWEKGEYAISSYQKTFDVAASSTMDQLEAIKEQWHKVIAQMSYKASDKIVEQKADNKRYVTPQEPQKKQNNQQPNKKSAASYDTYTVKEGDTLWDIARAKLGNGARYQEIYNLNKDILSDPNLIYPGQKLKLPKYAKGTLGVPENQFAWLDELGEELVMHADGSGKLAFLSKGSSVIPADLTRNLMRLGELNPQDILDRSRPIISAPQITNNNIELTMDIAEVVHIDTVTNDTIPNLTKAIDKQLDKYMKNLNSQVRKYSR